MLGAKLAFGANKYFGNRVWAATLSEKGKGETPERKRPRPSRSRAPTTIKYYNKDTAVRFYTCNIKYR